MFLHYKVSSNWLDGAYSDNQALGDEVNIVKSHYGLVGPSNSWTKILLPIPGKAKAKAMPGWLHTHTKNSCAQMCTVMPSCTQLCRVVPRCPQLLPVMPSRAQLYTVVHSCCQLCPVVHSCAQLYRVVHSCLKDQAKWPSLYLLDSLP